MLRYSLVFLLFAINLAFPIKLLADPKQPKVAQQNAQQVIQQFLSVSNIGTSVITPVSRTAAVYLTIKNNSDKPITLVDVETPVANHSMIHKTVMEDGVAKMLHQNTIIIPAQQEIEFSRGGLHIMLMGINSQKLLKGFSLTLIFNDHKPLKVAVEGRD